MAQRKCIRQAAITLAKLKKEKLINQMPELVRQIPAMSETKLLDISKCASMLEDFAFLLRGACASELRKRSEKLSGGRGRKDLAGTGIQFQLDNFAKKVGAGRKTLEIDAKIKDTFFPVIDQTILEQMPPLAREYYVIALSAPDPQAAIRSAIDRCSDPRFSLRVFRAEVRYLRVSGTSINVTKSAKSVIVLDTQISDEIDTLISDITIKTGMSKDEIVAAAIRDLHALLSKSFKQKSRVSNSSQSSKRTSDVTQLKLKM